MHDVLSTWAFEHLGVLWCNIMSLSTQALEYPGVWTLGCSKYKRASNVTLNHCTMFTLHMHTISDKEYVYLLYSVDKTGRCHILYRPRDAFPTETDARTAAAAVRVEVPPTHAGPKLLVVDIPKNTDQTISNVSFANSRLYDAGMKLFRNSKKELGRMVINNSFRDTVDESDG